MAELKVGSTFKDGKKVASEDYVDSKEVDTSQFETKADAAAHKAENTQDAHMGKNIGIEDAEGNFTAKNVEEALAELFTFADNVHQGWTDVIGSPILKTDTSEQKKSKTQQQKSNLATNLVNLGVSANGNETLQNLVNKVATIPVGGIDFVLIGTRVIDAGSGGVSLGLGAGVDLSRCVAYVITKPVNHSVDNQCFFARLYTETSPAGAPYLQLDRWRSNGEVTIYWYVIQFKKVKSLQSGQINLANNVPNTTINISQVNISKSLIFSSFSSESASNQMLDGACNVRFNNSTSIIAEHGGRQQKLVRYYVVEFD